MALRQTARFVIDPRFLQGTPIQPTVPFVPQLLSRWCWAACVAMVLSQRSGRPYPQCEAARLRFPDRDCCRGTASGCRDFELAIGPASSICNEVAADDEISNLWARAGVNAHYYTNILGEADLADAIDLGPGHGVQVSWRLEGIGPHVVLVVGHESGQYLVHDPCYQRRLVSHLELGNLDGVWRWRSAWILS